MESHRNRKAPRTPIGWSGKRGGASYHGLHFLIDAGDPRATRKPRRGHAPATIEAEAHRRSTLVAAAARIGRILLITTQMRRNEAGIVGVAVGTADADVVGGRRRRGSFRFV